MVKISVIVPVYNVEKYLPKCLDSLVNQTINDYEVIIINDGSPDNSQKIIDKYAKEFPNIIKPFIKENGGQASARNYALKKASGEYIMYVDSDDWIAENALEKLYEKAMDDNSDIVVCSAYKVLNDDYSLMESFDTIKDPIKSYILNRPSAWCKLIKKEVLKNKELYFLENHYYEDIAVVPAYCLYTKNISFLNMPLYYYLIREGSTMNQLKYTNSLEDIFDSLDYLESLFKSKNCLSVYKEELEFIYIENLLHAATLRFLPYKEGEKSILKIIKIMKEKFPNWKKNKYYKQEKLKYKIVCSLIYNGNYMLVKKILKI